MEIYKKYLTEENFERFVATKVRNFIKLYKSKNPDHKVYSGAKIKEVINWKPVFKYISINGFKTDVKKGELVDLMAKHFAHVLNLESPNAEELKAQFWIPEAMQFPAIDPDTVQEGANVVETEEQIAA